MSYAKFLDRYLCAWMVLNQRCKLSPAEYTVIWFLRGPRPFEL